MLQILNTRWPILPADGNGGYKKVDPVELTPQFILLGTIIFIFECVCSCRT